MGIEAAPCRKVRAPDKTAAALAVLLPRELADGAQR
jgi:hypothetical protein